MASGEARVISFTPEKGNDACNITREIWHRFSQLEGINFLNFVIDDKANSTPICELCLQSAKGHGVVRLGHVKKSTPLYSPPVLIDVDQRKMPDISVRRRLCLISFFDSMKVSTLRGSGPHSEVVLY